jgi:hypothetical protein
VREREDFNDDMGHIPVRSAEWLLRLLHISLIQTLLSHQDAENVPLTNFSSSLKTWDKTQPVVRCKPLDACVVENHMVSSHLGVCWVAGLCL